MVIKAVTPKEAGMHNGGTELTLTATESSLLLQYKELIRSQDNQLQEMHKQLQQYESERQSYHVSDTLCCSSKYKNLVCIQFLIEPF